MKPDKFAPTFSIKLITSDLDKDQIKSWYQTVKKYAPSGIMTNIMVPDEDGDLASALLIKRPKGNQVEYEIPTTRYLLDEELEPIAKEWDKVFPEDDFEIFSMPRDKDILTYQFD